MVRLLALAMPAPNRSQNNMKALTARPVAKEKNEKAMVAMATMGVRRMRSAIQPIGAAPSM